MKATLVGALLVLSLAGAVAWRIEQSVKASGEVKEVVVDATLIRVAKVERRGIDERVTFTGSILPKNEVDVFAKLSGRVETLNVQVGDKVHAGQLLAEVEHKEIGWQTKASEAQLQSAVASLKVAQANLDGVKLDYDRTKALFEGGSAPKAQLDGTRVKLQAAQAQIAQAEAGVAQAEAAKGLSEQQLENARIESPIAGVVTRKTVNVGVKTGPEAAAFTIQDVGTLKLASSVQAAVFAELARDMPVEITVDAFPGETFHGRVDVLSPTLDPQTRRAAVEIAIDNTKGRLLPHMFARSEVTIGHLKDVLVLPRDAVLEAPGGSIVYRVKSGHVESVRPTFGPDDGDFVSVQSGLGEGDEVARTGLGNLSDGASVRVAVAVTSKD